MKENFKIEKIWTIVIFMLTALPAFSTLQKGEAFLEEGKGEEALNALYPLAEKNDARALYLMAIVYLSPATKYHNMQRGVAYLERAVFQNYGPAIDELAGLYLVGEGVPKNEAKALHYYIQGSHLGYGPSQFNCGIMYKNGQGTSQDLKKAYLYLSLASLNHKDLGDVTLPAAHYRDEVARELSPTDRQEVLRQINALTRP